jgi:hypothetical protein
VTTLADLIAEVAAEHMPFSAFGEPSLPTCEVCTVDWPCDAARLAAALSVENVAAGLRAAGIGAIGQSYAPLTDAAALLAAMTVPG